MEMTDRAPALYLSGETMQRLAMLGASLDIDIYIATG